MKTIIILGLVVITTFYSCKKSESVVSVPTVEKVKVNVRVGGDITIGQSPLNSGRKLPDYIAAKDLYDSTVYAIDVRTPDGLPYAAGLYNTTGNIMIELLKGVNYTINIAAIKKGTSIGLYWGGTSGGYQYFFTPLNMAMKNEMIYNTDIIQSPDALNPDFLTSMSFIAVRGDIFSADQDLFFYSELDSYFGTTSYTAADSNSTLNINLKRISFGIKYNLIDYTNGNLVADYEGVIKTKLISWWNLNDNLGIYTADRFRSNDTLLPIHLTLKWEKNDGTTLTLGDKYLTPKRNSLTIINVTFPPNNTAKAGIYLTDTTFFGNNVVEF